MTKAAERFDFNHDWHFALSDADWPDDFLAAHPTEEPVILPHTWNAEDMTLGTTEPHLGAGWYRKDFDAPALAAGQRLLLTTEGVTNTHKLWVNHGYAGGRNGGFLPTQMDITDLLDDGTNSLLVRVDNRYALSAALPRNIDWNRYGGITRPVWLQIKEHAYLTCAGVEIETPEVSAERARTVVTVHVQETARDGASLLVRHTLRTPDGAEVSTTTTPLTTRFGLTHARRIELPLVEQPALWSDREPVLYTLSTELLEDGRVLDTRLDRVGYRFFHFDPDEGFFLNGVPTELRGANIHIFYPGLGNAVPERFHRREMELMKRMGCNYMRSSHYPRPKACLDACDELGILVMEEQPYWHGSLRAYSGEDAIDNAPRLMQEMVAHHRNHPCIIAWNTVNEVMLAPAYKPGTGHLEPTDPRRVAWAINEKEYPYIGRHLQVMVDALREADPSRPVCMVVGGAWQKNDDAGLTALADLVAYNGGALNFKDDFVGPATGEPYPFRPDYYRELFPRRVHLMSEGVLNDICFERGNWEAETNAWRNNARYWNAFGARSWFCGGSMWCFTDYTANGLIRLHGAVDRFRLPKELFHFYEAMWADHPVLHILGHWNHPEDEAREVVVFTNCDDIELILNGRSLGGGLSSAETYPHLPHPPRVWSGVRVEAGTLQVTGRRGEETLSDTRVTAGAPAQLRLSASNDTLHADGQDIAYIDVTLCDEAGNRCYTASAPVSVSVTGAARLAGPATRGTPGGLARFAIRSTGECGTVQVHVEGDGGLAGERTLRAV